MNKTKIWFGLMIIFLIALWAIVPFWFGRVSIIHVDPIEYNYTEHHSCHIVATEPTILLRMDDIRFQSKVVETLVSETLKENISITLGVIPESYWKDRSLINYLSRIKNDPRVEIAQHGVYHNESDISISERDLIKGNNKIQELLGVVPITYIPSYNKMTPTSLEFVKNHFNVISSAGPIIKEGQIAEIGQTVETYDYYNSKNVTVQSVVDKCAQNLNSYNLCVVVVHPQEFGVDKVTRLNEYRDLLYGLEQLNATFSTFNKVAFCSEEETDNIIHLN